MIPIQFLSKMGIYDVEIEPGVKVKAKLIDNSKLVSRNVVELSSLLQTPVVGLDVKFCSSFWPWTEDNAQMLILCVRNHCLIIQLAHLDVFPESLKKLLADETVCFVGIELNHKLATLHRTKNNNDNDNVICKTGVEVGDLAARVLKKPYISDFGLAYLANEARVGSSLLGTVFSSAGGRSFPPVNWSARAFTDEEIKCVIHEAYTCHAIASKLFKRL